MTFEVDGFHVIKLLEPYQRQIFTELVDDFEEPNLLDQLYQLNTGKIDDYINCMVAESIS